MAFDPNEQTEHGSEVPVAVVDTRSEAEQVTEIRASAIERSKAAQSTEWSFGWPASHYVDRAGPGTSPYDFSTLTTICSLIELPVAGLSITALKEAVYARIAALGLDLVALYKWSVEGHDEDESRKVRHMTLAEKIEKFQPQLERTRTRTWQRHSTRSRCS
jgi:hypothetical protein